MKIHFGFMENYGSYELPFYGCEETICGNSGEKVLEDYTTDDWDMVTCKKCLRLKDAIVAGEKIDEEAIVNEMGERAAFFKRSKIKRNVKKMKYNETKEA